LLAFGCAEVSGKEGRDETVPDGPNIILVMVDDMGWSDIGCFGSEIKTTNIDRLAKEGLLITQFYNNAKCTTTRASLLTGLYPRNVGHRW
jgi:arylsulfatase